MGKSTFHIGARLAWANKGWRALARSRRKSNLNLGMIPARANKRWCALARPKQKSELTLGAISAWSDYGQIGKQTFPRACVPHGLAYAVAHSPGHSGKVTLPPGKRLARANKRWRSLSRPNEKTCSLARVQLGLD